jgi:GntR family transcriptional regulator, N-acetylglucosamine utilization regulator
MATISTRLRAKLAAHRRSGTPRYEQLRAALHDLIREGQLGPGGALPAERELARLTGWSRVTVRKALAQLNAEGVVSSRPGAGNYVGGERIVRSFSKLTSFTEDLRSRGLNPKVVFLGREIADATSEEAMILAISPGSRVVRLSRLRYGGERPLAVESTVVPQDILSSPDLVSVSLYEALEALGLPPERALQRLHAVALDSATAALLKLPQGSPALQIERHAYLADGRPVEFTRSVYVADAYDFVAELRRG